ncbi:hypothetical protein SAMN05421505_14719 [Sinosporangium album]|uniref:Uncharacterized protein n=1 Tax=Sinosporangium album TaxID=504805 RepID=A0A1G8K3W8_9ACTN|nr:hypothetical protein SAMN05421505_14719 [Sinosporangium album]
MDTSDFVWADLAAPVLGAAVPPYRSAFLDTRVHLPFLQRIETRVLGRGPGRRASEVGGSMHLGPRGLPALDLEIQRTPKMASDLGLCNPSRDSLVEFWIAHVLT